MIHLDTNAVIALLNERSTALRDRFMAARAAEYHLAISSVVFHELMYGVAWSAKRATNEVKISVFLSSTRITIEPFTDADSRAAADIRADLRRAGTPIGPYDLLIAAQALQARALLVTANTREFARVAGLNVVDWSV